MSDRQVWRLIPFFKAPAKVQMAVDRWLLEEHRQQRLPPSLRFYQWSPLAISLGYHQHQFPDAWHNLSWQGERLDIVRRPTGGRAVLHQGDLTYMIVTSAITGKRWQVYQYLCQFLLQGWRSLGVDLNYGSSGRGYIHNPSCFSTATAADLVTSKGNKLIGSAQLYQGSAVLQHGSMVLSTSPQLFQQVFEQPAPWQQGLMELLNFSEDLAAIISVLTAAAKDCFEIEFVTEALSAQEWQEIKKQV